ncbi:Hypothetical predicted protein [Lecanosticta acicola]|uniref:Uncharacterized protein n=1 Tax=Lecanosticta acicola TaxID=111012 RepID=A0AAI8YWW6_9PEZI|nr:Hypothetical predicted protein [Lecanosticta acicola]
MASKRSYFQSIQAALRRRLLRHILQLPEELILLVLRHYVRSLPPINLDFHRDIAKTARSIIPPDFPATDKLVRLCTHALLQDALLHFRFQIQGSLPSRFVVMPPFVTKWFNDQIRHYHQICHFELCVDSRLTFKGLRMASFPYSTAQYPIGLYTAKDAMDSLISQMTRLQSLRILISGRFDKSLHSEDRFGRRVQRVQQVQQSTISWWPTQSVYSRQGMSTVAAAIADLLTEAKRPNLQVFLQIECRHLGERMILTPSIELGDRPVSIAVEECFSGELQFVSHSLERCAKGLCHCF